MRTENAQLHGTKPTPASGMLTYAELAAHLAIGLRTCKRWVANGTLPAPDLRIGGVVRWHRDTIERWLIRQRRATR